MISGKAPVVSRKNIISTITDRVFSISKAKYELGHEATITLLNGVKETIIWYQNEHLV